MAYSDEMKSHLAGGSTTLARAWLLTRRDGVALGFTDHDRALSFGGYEFLPGSGMTARALAQSTGLSVDNTEVYGALNSERITEADLLAGRYDGAELSVWRVNWADTGVNALIFRGSLGEVSRASGAFTAELRGLTEALNTGAGRVYHPRCSAILGDGKCGVDLTQPGYAAELAAETVDGGVIFGFSELAGFDDRWFEKGRLRVLSGAAQGLVGVVKNDRVEGTGARTVELWERIGATVLPGDLIRLEAGCDKRAETCRLKFDNFLNFRGFPHIPGDDWLLSYPVSAGNYNGGSLFQ